MIGIVPAPDADSAVKETIKLNKITDPDQQRRLVAVRE